MWRSFIYNVSVSVVQVAEQFSADQKTGGPASFSDTLDTKLLQSLCHRCVKFM